MKDDFKIRHAKMLLKRQTYLSYNIEIKLKSAEAYEAIIYFLKRIKIFDQKISDQFFRKVEADVDIGWLDSYNKFIKSYLNMGFDREELRTELNESITEHDKMQIVSKKPILEF